jgi:HSP20 family protein
MRRRGRFEYRTTLPDDVDKDRIEASLDKGVLTVRIPRPEPAQRTASVSPSSHPSRLDSSP